jgi:DNA-binding response OmpR family regulator
MHEKILVVDDDPGICDAMKMILEIEGYRVHATERGEYAEGMIDRDNHYPKLIIMDMFLSGMDGRDITRKLKKTNKTHDIPIVMISAHPHAHKEARDAGADDFIPKPFDVETLLLKVKKYIN